MRLPLLLAAIVLAACAPGPKVSADPPTGERELVLRMTQLPGLLPPGGGLTLPAVSVFGGGLAIVSTPQGLVQRQLTPAGVKKVSQAAADAGLTTHVDAGPAEGPDTGSVTFVVVSGGKRQVNLIASPQGEIGALVSNLLNLDTFLGPDIAAKATPYQHTGLAIWAQPQETSAQAKPWQFADLAAAGEPYETGRCQLAAPDQAPKLNTVTSGDLWSSNGITYYVILRPLLPDEEKCPRVESLAAS